MTEAHDSRYPSVDEQAVEVYDNLRDEMNITLDCIRCEFGAKASVLAYISLIRQARVMLNNLRGGVIHG